MSIALAACVTAPAPDPNKVQPQVEVLDKTRRFELAYLLQPGDQLEIYLHKHNDLSRKVTVRPDGYISLPLIDEIKVSGMTPLELAKDLRDRFGMRLRDPEVNVIVQNPPEPVVYVVGQAGAPKAVPLRQASTVAAAVAQAGDLAKSAALTSLSVIRLNDAGYLEALAVPGLDQNPSQPEIYMAMVAMPVKANDLIVIPESVRSQIVRTFQDASTVLVPLANVLILRELYK